MIDPDAMALSWWNELSPRDHPRCRRLVHRGHDTLLPRARHAGLPPPGWCLVRPGHSRAGNDGAHRFEQILGGGGNYRMPDPVRQLIFTDLDHRPSTDDVAPPTQRSWPRRFRSS